jgi:hypothetical protein
MNRWQSFFRILPVVTLMALMLMSYNHCLHPEQNAKKKKAIVETNLASPQAQSGDVVFQERSVSLQAFEQTVYPLTTQHCVLCHSSMQQPLHASTSIEVAHDQLRDGQLVNFSNVENSRMVLKLRQELHNCWSGSCESSATQMAQAIERWNEIIETARSASNTSNNSSDTDQALTRLITNESMSFTQSMNNQSINSSGMLNINLASALLRSPMMLTNNNGMQVMTTPSTIPMVNDPTNSSAGTAFFNFNNSQSDVFDMWVYLSAPNNNADSLYVRVNNGTTYYEWHTGVTNNFQWRKLSHSTNRLDVPLYLPQGSNILEIRHREAGLQIAQIIFTNDQDFDPTTDDIKQQITLSYDLAPLLNGMQARLEIDVEDYNAYAYRFSRPRIQFTSGSLKVKKLNIHVNGQMNPQNSTYTLVDRTITPQDNLLSNNSMIVLKEHGNDEDVFSFEFERLEP